MGPSIKFLNVLVINFGNWSVSFIFSMWMIII